MNISYKWLKRYIDFNLSPQEVGDALTSLCHRLYVHLFCAVPVFDRTNTYCARNAENVIAIAHCQQTIIRIPITLCQFKLRRSLAIRVNRLFLVEIDTISHQLTFHSHAMMMKLMVGIYSRFGMPLCDRIAMPCFPFSMNDGITCFRRVSRSTNLPKGRSNAWRARAARHAYCYKRYLS